MKTALLVVDIQKDLCPGGSLAVEEGDHVIEPTNRLIRHFEQQGWPVCFICARHPADHESFVAKGGPWPPHCVADTGGAELHDLLHIPLPAIILSKSATPEQEAYSCFDGTNLEQMLKQQGITAMVIAGLATDYCVKNTALDAHRLGFAVTVAIDAVRALNVRPDDGRCAIRHMQIRGVRFAEADALIASLKSH